MPIRFGVNTFIWAETFDRSHEHLLPAIKAHGFDGIEVPLFRPSEFVARDVRQMCRAHGLECTVVSVLVDGLSLIGEEADLRRRTQIHLRESIRATAEAGARVLAGPLYCPLGVPGHRRRPDEWQRAVEGYQSLGDTLVEHGVTLAIEPLNRFETFFLNTAADAAALCDAVGHPSVGVLYDTFHANIEEKDIAAGLRRVAPHLKHLHMCENDRGIPGSGHVEWVPVFQAILDAGYDGWCTIESFGFSLGNLSAAASIWRDIEATPESIAFEGLKFLKRHLRAA